MPRTAYVLLLLTALIWGSNAVAGKLAVDHISPLLLTTLRWAIGLALLMAIGWRQLVADWPVARKSLPLLFALGTCGFTFFNAAFYTALNHTSAINVAIEQAAIPMVIFAINFALFALKVSRAQMIGFLLTIVGVALTVSHGDPARLLELDVNFGDALMIVAVLCYGGYTVALRYKPDIHWKSLMAIMSLAAAVSSLPFAAWELHAGNAIMPDARGWAIVVYTAIFPTILAQVFYIHGVEIIGSNRAGIFVNMVPIFGTVLSILILGEAFHAYHAIAMVLVIGGIWLAETSGRRMAKAGPIR